MRRIRATIRVLRAFLASAVLGFGGMLAATLLVPVLFGDQVMLTVMSGSMEPTIHTGDVVVDRQIAPLDARVGDIVTFTNPENPGMLLTHRVRDIRLVDGAVQFETRGDANNNSEIWVVPKEGTIGVVKHRLHRLGYALVWARGRQGQLLLVVVPALALAASLLVSIWRRPDRRGSSADAPPA